MRTTCSILSQSRDSTTKPVPEYEIATTAVDAETWLKANGGRFVPNKEQPPAVLSDVWLETVDGATLLEELFIGLSDNRLRYKKTTHTPRLSPASQRDRS